MHLTTPSTVLGQARRRARENPWTYISSEILFAHVEYPRPFPRITASSDTRWAGRLMAAIAPVGGADGRNPDLASLNLNMTRPGHDGASAGEP
jgi:hypothetical protein